MQLEIAIALTAAFGFIGLVMWLIGSASERDAKRADRHRREMRAMREIDDLDRRARR